MDIRELIHSVDIVEFISQFVDLEQKGDEWWGLSCFQDEKTPSFSVRKDPPFFFDYSSGKSGNLWNFVIEYFHCSASRAIEILKEFAGIDGDISYESNKLAAASVCLLYAPTEKRQKEASGVILPENYMERYEDRPEKLWVWENEGISKDSLRKFQVKYDAFSNRLVYPVRNPDGTIVNIGGRTLDPDFKEKNLRKYTYFFSFGTIQTIYGLSENMEEIQKRQEIILFEGCKSVLLADTWGIRNTGAILTSHLSAFQLSLLIRLGCTVVFALDKEIDITKDKNIRKLKDYTNVEYLVDTENLLSEKDAPVDKGQDVFRKLYHGRRRFR